MIRINLLPFREARRRAELRDQLGLVLLAIVVAGGLSVVLQLWSATRLSGARNEVARIEKKITEYEPEMKQLRQFEGKRSEVERKLGVIRKIECSQIVPQTRDVAFAFVGGIVFDLLQRRPVEQLRLAHELPRPAGTVGLLEFDAEFGGKIVRRQIAAFPCGRVGRIVRIIEPAARRVHIFG